MTNDCYHLRNCYKWFVWKCFSHLLRTFSRVRSHLIRSLYLYSLGYCLVTIMACNLESQIRKTFNQGELVPNCVGLVFSQEELAGDREQITVFPISAEYLSHQHRTNILSRIVKQLLVWSRYIQRLWRYFLE